MNINNKLIAFAQDELVLGHKDAERDSIKASLEHLEKVLNDKLKYELSEIKRFGSYTRNMILPRRYDPQSDIDLLIVFKTSEKVFTPGTYRKHLHEVIDGAYPKSSVKKDFPTVKLELNHIIFDLVPSYYKESWAYGNSYYIPDVNDGWRKTIPNDLNEILTTKNQSYGDNIVRNTIRLCKCWNANAGYPFYSYEMEKAILNLTFYWGKNLYESFVNILTRIAGNRPGVNQATTFLNQYSYQNNEQKQFEWLQKLLPGLT